MHEVPQFKGVRRVLGNIVMMQDLTIHGNNLVDDMWLKCEIIAQ